MKTNVMCRLVIVALLLTGCGPRGESVAFSNEGVTLSGTLLRPDVEGQVPAVVLIHGSGETDRSSLRYYAEIFVENGYAALIYDKRGVGKSGGDPEAWRDFNFEDLAADAAAAVDLLSRRPDIDGARIGIFGVSQGAWVAPLAAVQANSVSFMVMLSASVATVAEDRLFERAARLRKEGFTEAEIAEVGEMHRADQELTRSGEGSDRFAELWDSNRQKRWFRRVYLGDAPEAADSEWRAWYRTVLDYDPVPLLRDLSVPTLWLFGDPSHDRFGPVQASVDRLEALRDSGKQYDIVVFEGADHNLRMVDGDDEAPFKATLAEWLAGVQRAD